VRTELIACAKQPVYDPETGKLLWNLRSEVNRSSLHLSEQKSFFSFGNPGGRETKADSSP